jgi:hypothetical protein
MANIALQPNTTYPGFFLSSSTILGLSMDDSILDFLVLTGTTIVGIGSGAPGGTTGGVNRLPQLVDVHNDLTAAYISGSTPFQLGSFASDVNTSDGVVTDGAAFSTTVASSLKLINASGTTGLVTILAGATNTSAGGTLVDGNRINATITYTGLTIKGGSGTDTIENDAKNGIVTDGNGNFDNVTLGGANAKATLGTGAHDAVAVGLSNLGTIELAGGALGDKVTFGAAATATLFVGTGAEAGLTATTTSIGLTKVVNAAAGMQIDFSLITHSSFEAALGPGVVLPNLTTAENIAVAALAGPGVAFFNFGGNEYFVATNHTETAVSPDDAIVKLVGVHDLTANTSSGVVTLAHL